MDARVYNWSLPLLGTMQKTANAGSRPTGLFWGALFLRKDDLFGKSEEHIMANNSGWRALLYGKRKIRA